MNSIRPSGIIRELKVGETVSFEDGTSLTILDAKKNGKIWLGKGGQGIVYLADYHGKQYAFKWFINESFLYNEDKPFYDNILYLSTISSQKKMRNFMLPIKVTVPDDNGQFGYLMNLIDTTEYVELKDILSRKYSFDNLEYLLLACENIAREMDQLHKFNSIFCDLNGGGFFINLSTGDLKICDCDNIKQAKDKPSPLGADGYRAPELYYKDETCTKESDLHSLAVILFKLLVGVDPYMGTKFVGDEPPIEIYSEKAVFVCDPEDDSNRPKNPDFFDRWKSDVDPTVQDILTTTLSSGIDDPSKRTKAVEFLGAFNSWRTSIDREDPLAGFLEPPPKDPRIQYLLFIVDSSASMDGERMDEVNLSIKETVEYLKTYSQADSQIQFKIGVMQFSKECEWHKSYAPTDIQEITFVPLKTTGKPTLLHKACRLLDDSLGNGVLIDPECHYKKAIILFISDGAAPLKYRDYMKLLRDNHRFESAHVISIGIDDESIDNEELNRTLVDFAKGDPEHVAHIKQVKGKLGQTIAKIATTLSTLTTAAERDSELANILTQLKR